MKQNRLEGIICYIIITIMLFLIGCFIYSFIEFEIVKHIFMAYCIFAFITDVFAVIYFTDDDNLM